MTTALAPARPSGPVRGRGDTEPQGILRLGAGSGLALGLVLLWMSILVLLPLVAVLVTSVSDGVSGFVATVTSPAGGRVDPADGGPRPRPRPSSTP